jgi:phosphopentomutase
MKKNITLDSVINRHNENKHDLIETLTTLVKRQGGFIEVYNCEIETKEEMRIDTLVCTNDVIFITYIDNNNYEVVCSTDDFTYDELYEMVRSVCKQLNL